MFQFSNFEPVHLANFPEIFLMRTVSINAYFGNLKHTITPKGIVLGLLKTPGEFFNLECIGLMMTLLVLVIIGIELSARSV